MKSLDNLVGFMFGTYIHSCTGLRDIDQLIAEFLQLFKLWTPIALIDEPIQMKITLCHKVLFLWNFICLLSSNKRSINPQHQKPCSTLIWSIKNAEILQLFLSTKKVIAKLYFIKTLPYQPFLQEFHTILYEVPKWWKNYIIFLN